MSIARRSEDAQLVLQGIVLLIQAGTNLTQSQKDDLSALREDISEVIFDQIFLDAEELIP